MQRGRPGPLLIRGFIPRLLQFFRCSSFFSLVNCSLGCYNASASRQREKMQNIEGNAMKEIKQACLKYMLAFGYWIIAGGLIGGLCGVIGGFFAMGVEWATHLRQHHDWLLYLLPLGGLMIAGLYRLLRLPLSLGTDEIIKTVRTQGKVPLQMAPAIFLSTGVTHLFGGSAGREGAALQLGGSIGAKIGNLVHPRQDGQRIFELCGMAALFSALFGTPLTATIFVLEIIEVGKFNDRALMPCLVSAICAKLAALAIGAPAEIFPLASGLEGVHALSLVQSGLIGIACALCAIAFCCIMHFANRHFRRVIGNDFLRIALGGAAIIGLSLLLGTRDYNGGGMHVIFSALEGHARPEAFLLKMLFTALTLGAGFKGGEIVPSFFIGATLGCTLAGLIGLSPALGAALGLIGVFCGVTNAPLAAMMLSIELFGVEYLPLFGLTAVISYMLSGHFSLYHAQLFFQPKLGRDQEE